MHEHGAELWDGVERLELRVRIRGDRGDAIPLRDSETTQDGGPAVTPVEELLVREAHIAVDHRWPGGVKAS